MLSSPIQSPSAFFLRKHNGIMEVAIISSHEQRNQSTLRLISTADYMYSFNDFDWVIVNCGDEERVDPTNQYRILSYSNSNDEFRDVIPDYIFDSWPVTQLDNYDIKCRQIDQAGTSIPKINSIGWRGAITHANRLTLINKCKKLNDTDVEEIVWNRKDSKRFSCSNFVSLEDGVKRWRHLIDIEGYGYSGRLKLYLFSHRVLFIQDRPHKEWFFPKLIPYEHYVPVNRDLSDLEDKLDLIRSNPELEKHIVNSSYEFAKNNLTRKHAIDRMAEVFSSL